mgnify:CR=1 FL=1
MQILKTFSYHTLLILFVIFSSTNHNSKSTDKLIIVNKNIQVKSYFQYIDSIVKHYNSINNYKLSEHILVRHNPWIIDSLANTDYYRMIAKDSFVYNQKDLIVLRKGCSIKIPDSLESSNIEKEFKSTWIDLNIPEYKLRIYRDSVLLHEFLVRVGRNEKKYLKMAGRVLDLKTKTGSGTIVKYVKNPDYYNPVNGNQYFVTNRDDGKVTKLPQIPFIETEINGIRDGQLIHPTTNQETLGKAYSNGCIGTKEADAWIIYYYAPIGTKIKIRYDLNVLDKNGNKQTLKDIYN